MPVVDASVWVAITHSKDRHHGSSSRWLESMLLEGEGLAAPSLLTVEVAAAVRRLTGDRAVALAAVETMLELGVPDLVPLTEDRSRRSAEIAAATGVRGADAVYLQLAAERNVALVTWDRQQLERGGGVARVERPG